MVFCSTLLCLIVVKWYLANNMGSLGWFVYAFQFDPSLGSYGEAKEKGVLGCVSTTVGTSCAFFQKIACGLKYF